MKSRDVWKQASIALHRSLPQAYDAKRAQRDAEREAEEAAQEAEIAAAAAARAKREEEEALKWRSMFTVEDQGQEALTQEEDQDRESRIVDYIKTWKTVELDSLAAEFGMKVQDTISLVQSLEAAGKLTGIMDDRGKFIYISTSELELVAETIRSRGRISIAELAQVSSELIDLEPKAPKEAPEVDFESDAVMLDPVT
ncbi:hypothetical protein QBZ16_001278 [Prototheca wickerhamii]|uniref:DDRGK domain-containing protein 1 n=1 Tax=Prototheca wickerhamii TaxID=3111 RepID=A0AAD9IGX3_PROWI|nr:hypothetical protein QBZ16_001278 [Prototheca wickerhamii]